MNRNDRNLTAFAMLGHSMFHTCELVIPIFVTVWLDGFSVTTATLGIVVGAAYALTGVGALPSGVLADRYGGSRLVVACMVGMGAGFLVVAAAPTVPVLAAGLLLWGAAASIYHPAGLTLISRGATERGTAFAYHGMAGNVGVATGPLLGAVLLAFFGWRTVAVLLVVPLVVAIVAALRLDFEEGAAESDDERDAGVDSLSGFLRQSRRLFVGGFVLVFLVGNLYGLYYRGSFTFLPDILGELPLFEPATLWGRTVEPSQYVYSGLLILGGLGQFAGGKLVDRVQAEYALVGTFAALVVVAVMFVPAAEAGIVPLLVVAGLLGFLVFMEAPINQEVISRHVPTDVRGLSFGYTYVAVLGVGALGAAVAGVVLSRWDAAALFTLLAGLAVVAVGLGVYLARTTPADYGTRPT
jgi:MFS family permease